MGANDRAQNRKDDKARAAQAKRKVRDRSGSVDGVADWTLCDGQLLAVLVATVSSDGGAVRLGYTRDGGAYAVGIYGDGEPYTLYITPKEDLNEWIRETIEDFRA